MGARKASKADTSRSVPLAVGDLAGLDTLDSAFESIGVFGFSDQRPLRGVAGFLDWRLCGVLSAAILSGCFGGRVHEATLRPATSRLGWRRVFLFGLGPVAEADTERVKAVAEEAWTAMRGAGAQKIVWAAPASNRRPDAERVFVRAVRRSFFSRVDKILVEHTV